MALPRKITKAQGEVEAGNSAILNLAFFLPENAPGKVMLPLVPEGETISNFGPNRSTSAYYLFWSAAPAQLGIPIHDKQFRVQQEFWN